MCASSHLRACADVQAHVLTYLTRCSDSLVVRIAQSVSIGQWTLTLPRARISLLSTPLTVATP
jgi:hypothetical protein